MRTGHCEGRFVRVADPDWDNPLDGTWAQRRGGRWNAPGSHATVYLNGSLAVARVNARAMLRRRTLAGMPFGFEDLDPAGLPVLVTTRIAPSEVCECVTDEGVIEAGLPVSYPLDESGAVVAHARCQPVGAAAVAAGLCGVWARSAAAVSGGDGPVGVSVDSADAELAWFPVNGGELVVDGRPVPFDEWFWTHDADGVTGLFSGGSQGP